MDIKNMNFGWATGYGKDKDLGNEIRVPVSGWFRCGEYDEGRATLEIRALTNTDLECRVVLELADSPDDSSFTVKEIGSYFSAEGIHYPTTWTPIGTQTETNQIARICVEFKRKTTNGPEWARVSGRVELKTC